jgi:hypothetical protein
VPHPPSLERARVRFESFLELANPPVVLAGTVPSRALSDQRDQSAQSAQSAPS